MSHYLYLRCESHDPHILSDDHVGYRLSDLPEIREHLKNRDMYLMGHAHGLTIESDDPRARRAFRFLVSHPNCVIGIEDEYGETHSVS